MVKIDRRNFLRTLTRQVFSFAAVRWLGCLDSESWAQALEGQEVVQDITPEQWMDELQSSLGILTGNLNISRFVEPVYYLTKPISWRPKLVHLAALKPVEVPRGFVTDFASIPRIFWSVLRPDGEYAHAAIIHDFLYWTQTVSREDADLVFKQGMKDLGVNEAKIALIYNAVRAFGGFAWEKNAKLKANGEKRLLKVFPDDPLARWVDWKVKPDVLQ